MHLNKYLWNSGDFTGGKYDNEDKEEGRKRSTI